MKQAYLKGLVAGSALVGGFFLNILPAAASTPSLSAFYTGNGDYVQINISNADPNVPVLLNYASSLTSLGATNANGSLSLTISTAQYGIPAGSVVSASVNGQTSNTIQWPYTNLSGSFSLSQTSISLIAGQSTVVTVNPSGSYYLSSNSNPSVANIAINGNQITVTGNTAGTTNGSICSLVNPSTCASATISVSGSGTQTIYFSQNNLSMSSGQIATVVVTGGSGAYSIVGNSNSASVQTNLSGSVITLTAGATMGSSAITVCSANTSFCSVLNVTVGTNANYSVLVFTPANPSLAFGQATSVSIIGGIAPYYVSSNSNSGIVQATLSNNILTLSAQQTAGSATVTVCSATNACGSVVANVNSTNGAISFGQSNISIPVGQSSNIPIYGSSNYYLSSNSSASVASAVISGTNVFISGLVAGTDSIGICSSAGQCGTIFVTVGGTGTVSSSNATVSLYQSLAVGSQQNLLISGGTAPYYVSPASNSAFSATINNGSTLTLTGLSVGISSVSVCSYNGSCATLNVTVTNTSASSGASNAGNAPSGISDGYVFNNLITYGMKNTDVLELQKRLASLGFYGGPLSGYYGDLTTKAVRAFQTARGIAAAGYVGPSTRAALNR